MSSYSHFLAPSVKHAEGEVTPGLTQELPQSEETIDEEPVSAFSTSPRGETAVTVTSNEHQETQPGLFTKNTLSNHTATPLKPLEDIPLVQDSLKDHTEAQTPPAKNLSEKNFSTETLLTEKTYVDTPVSTVPPSIVNPSAIKDGTQRNCNFNDSQVKDDQASIDSALVNMTNVNSCVHTASNVNENSTITDKLGLESQKKNATILSKTQVDFSNTSESSVAGNNNSKTEEPCDPNVHDGAHGGDASAASYPPTSQPKSHKLLKGRKKGSKEGNL